MCLDVSLIKADSCFNVGGLGRLLLMTTTAAKAAGFVIGTAGATEHHITTITTPQDVYEVQFDPRKPASTAATQGDATIKTWDISIIISAIDRSNAAHKFFQKMNECCELVAFAQENSGIWKIYGINYNQTTHSVIQWIGLSPAVDDITGESIEAGSQYDARLEGKQNYLGLIVDAAVVTALEAAIVI